MPTAQQSIPRALSNPHPRTRRPVVLFSAFDPADQVHWSPLSVASATARGESPARVGRQATSTSDPAPSRADVSERVDGGVDLPELYCQPLLPLGVTTGGGFFLVLGAAGGGGPCGSSCAQAKRGRMNTPPGRLNLVGLPSVRGTWMTKTSIVLIKGLSRPETDLLSQSPHPLP